MRPRTIDLESLMTLDGVALTESAIARIFNVPLATLSPWLAAMRREGIDGHDHFKDDSRTFYRLGCLARLLGSHQGHANGGEASQVKRGAA
jgi:hypothetical protein